MITITDTTQRIFFKPSEDLDGVQDICQGPPIWLLTFGVWSDCGIWDDTAQWNDTPQVLQVQTILTTSADTIKKQAFTNFEKVGRVYALNINFFDGVPDDDYIMTLVLVDEVVYTTRLKITRQTVARKEHKQPVTTRKVNRTVAI